MKKFALTFRQIYTVIFIGLSMLVVGCISIPCTTACGTPEIEIDNFQVSKVDKVSKTVIRVHFTFESSVDIDQALKDRKALHADLQGASRFGAHRDEIIGAWIDLQRTKESRSDFRGNKWSAPLLLPNGRYQYAARMHIGNEPTLSRVKKLIADDGGVMLYLGFQQSLSVKFFGGSLLKLSLSQLGVD